MVPRRNFKENFSIWLLNILLINFNNLILFEWFKNNIVFEKEYLICIYKRLVVCYSSFVIRYWLRKRVAIKFIIMSAYKWIPPQHTHTHTHTQWAYFRYIISKCFTNSSNLNNISLVMMYRVTVVTKL
jgi:hypothetical protein